MFRSDNTNIIIDENGKSQRNGRVHGPQMVGKCDRRSFEILFGSVLALIDIIAITAPTECRCSAVLFFYQYKWKEELETGNRVPILVQKFCSFESSFENFLNKTITKIFKEAFKGAFKGANFCTIIGTLSTDVMLR